MLSNKVSSVFSPPAGRKKVQREYHIPCFGGESTLNLAKLRLTFRSRLFPLGGIDRLDSNLKRSANGSVVAGTDLMPSVLQLLDTSDTPIEQPIAPCR